MQKKYKSHFLSKIEQVRLKKLNIIFNKLQCGKTVQNRQLATWLTEEEYESFEKGWESQKLIREELEDKPEELERYEDKLKQAIFSYNRAEAYSTKRKSNTARKVL